ncbi:sensor domain-containing diguanylate cyclase [Tepidibacter aestuarii]|uniref:sensor domain-containing diguanylate cyclase n=1 Tax=Tepidibacter aestuarii TaxID=2925782 RepID=UPI0020C04C5E|nr:sensor domain-containing diguanylate cyclase [Tepidibacter aestuarii]CAH2213416.1 PAS domain S-box-containing protein/diguanylate cyclase (GGDEF) domain-containing protein [Tepidibacter aestuarii]
MSLYNFFLSLFRLNNWKKSHNRIKKNKEQISDQIELCLNCGQTIKMKENFKFLQNFIDTIPNPMFYKDEGGFFKYCNIAFTEFLGFEKEEIIGHTIYDINPKELAEIYYKADIKLMKNRDKQTYEAKLKHKDGSIRDVIINKAVVTNEKEEIKGIVCSITDITERKKDQKRINKLLKLKEAMLEISYSIIGVNDINELFDLILQKAIDSIENASIGSVLILDDNENLKIATSKGYVIEESKKFSIKLNESIIWDKTKGNIDKTIIINDVDKINKINFLTENEALKIKSVICSPIIIDRKLYGFINIDSNYTNVFDDTDLEIMEYIKNQVQIAISKYKLYEELFYSSRYDKLTNVYNRRYFEDLFDGYINKSTKYKENFSLVVFDLNELKFVNDNYGHLAGDELIKAFAKNLSECIRSSDILVRLGGDEFVGVFFKTSSQNLIKKFEDLIENFKNNQIVFEGNNITCSFSYGIAEFPEDSNNYKELIKIADKRMYKYKQGLKNNE